MSAAAGRGPARVGRAIVSAAATPAGWVVAVVVLVAALVVGSIHPSPPTRAQRIATLESVLKCPNCVDLSIAQSDTAAAANLRAEVARLVSAGRTNAEIEATVEGQYGADELLSPPASGIDTLAWAVPVAGLGGGGLVLALLLARRRRFRGTSLDAPPSDDDEALVGAALGRAGEGGVAR